MYLTEAIRKKFLVIVKDNETVKSIKRLYKYDDVISYRSFNKADGIARASWIDHDVPIDKIDLERLEVVTLNQVYYGNSQDNEAVDVLNNYQDVLQGQNRVVMSAIELRIYSSFIQKFLQDLERANPELGLTETINNLVKLHNQFDKDAMEYGPYTKEQYIQAVLTPHFDKL